MGLYTSLDSNDINKIFYPALEAGIEKVWSLGLALMNSGSNRATEEYNWLGQVPIMSKWVGNRAEKFFNKYSLTITNELYETTVPVEKNDLRRDKTGFLQMRLGELASRANSQWNTLAALLINAGTAGTQGLAYDGQFFFDTDHNESGTNQTNDLTTTEIPSSNVAATAAPTATEAANILNEAIAWFYSLTDDQGEPINQEVAGVTVVTSKPTIASAFRMAANPTITNLVSGATNPARGLTQTIDVVYSPRLTAADAITVYINDGSTFKPLIFQEEQGVELQQQTEGSSEDFNFDRYVFGVRAVRGYGYGAWQKALYIPLT